MLLPTILLAGPLLAAALPSSSSTPGLSIPLSRRTPLNTRSTADRLAWFEEQANRMNAKYGGRSVPSKRANSAANPLTDLNADLGYVGQITVGTPAKQYQVILDTGSSDLWLASADCTTGCSSITSTYTSSSSTSFKDTLQTIDIKYGSGEVAGTIGTDTVTMSGFTVNDQALGVITQVSANVVTGATSGLMGLAWTPLAQTAVDPWWLTLAKGNAWTQPLFAFYLARFADVEGATASESNGGSMDIGFTNNTYYTGDIEYTALSSQSYWLIPLVNIVIGGKTTTVGTQAAIDTGTSLIGGPPELMASLYAQIPGAKKGTGSLSQYYVYPCSTDVSVAMTFGTKTYSIKAVDFSLPVTGTTCAGAFFGLSIDGGNTGLEWVVGDSFLKNVYSVYRFNPPAVGFANLATAFGGGGDSSTPSSVTQSRALPTDTGLPTGTKSSVKATATGAHSTAAGSGSAAGSQPTGSGTPSGAGVVGVSGLGVAAAAALAVAAVLA